MRPRGGKRPLGKGSVTIAGNMTKVATRQPGASVLHPAEHVVCSADGGAVRCTRCTRLAQRRHPSEVRDGERLCNRLASQRH